MRTIIAVQGDRQAGLFVAKLGHSVGEHSMRF